jgi:hypothetical protein
MMGLYLYFMMIMFDLFFAKNRRRNSSNCLEIVREETFLIGNLKNVIRKLFKEI